MTQITSQYIVVDSVKMTNPFVNSFRCLQCGKLLAKYKEKTGVSLQIKCPRCRTINEV